MSMFLRRSFFSRREYRPEYERLHRELVSSLPSCVTCMAAGGPCCPSCHAHERTGNLTVLPCTRSLSDTGPLDNPLHRHPLPPHFDTLTLAVLHNRICASPCLSSCNCVCVCVYIYIYIYIYIYNILFFCKNMKILFFSFFILMYFIYLHRKSRICHTNTAHPVWVMWWIKKNRWICE